MVRGMGNLSSKRKLRQFAFLTKYRPRANALNCVICARQHGQRRARHHRECSWDRGENLQLPQQRPSGTAFRQGCEGKQLPGPRRRFINRVPAARRSAAARESGRRAQTLALVPSFPIIRFSTRAQRCCGLPSAATARASLQLPNVPGMMQQDRSSLRCDSIPTGAQ